MSVHPLLHDYIDSIMNRPNIYDQVGRHVLDRVGMRFVYVKDKLLDYENPQFKAALLATDPCVVGIATLGVPVEMTKLHPRKIGQKNQAFMGSGTIIECHKNDVDANFSATILTTASLFIRSNGVQPSDIEVLVYLANGDICQGNVLACDFHYNLALVNVQLKTPVQPPKFRDLDDIMSIRLTDQSNDSQPFQLRRHSPSFKIRPGDDVAALVRFCSVESNVLFGRFSAGYPGMCCKELYSISCKDKEFQDACGGPVINCHGEVIGILAVENFFLPSNIVSRWWLTYKNVKKIYRPWLGLKVANLHSANLQFLSPFSRAFPTVSSGIIVTEVVINSAAHYAGLLREDVIVQCNGASVVSTLDFFDKIWDMVGELVELSLLRGANHLNVKVTVDDATRDNFYTWPIPKWGPRPKVDVDIIKLNSNRRINHNRRFNCNRTVTNRKHTVTNRKRNCTHALRIRLTKCYNRNRRLLNRSPN